MKTLPIPTAVLDQHVIALGKTGSGKSSKVRVLIEWLLDHGEPVCILDPKGDWWGLKSSADGKSAGYPVVIFGGKHADVPLNPRAGAAIAELVFTGNRPCIVDMRELRPSERTRFFIDFATTAFRVTKGKRWLVISEIHNFAPKGRVLSPEAGEMLYWANRLASEGRGLGINLLADSQRPQKVHNDVLDSCETLIACRQIHKSGRDAIKDWIDGAADPEQGKVVLRELATMTRPEAYVWSPEIDFGPKRMVFPLFRTYDSFKPQPDVKHKLKGWAEVDLDEVSSQLSAVVAEAQANDPSVLKKRIRELEAQMAKSASIRMPAVSDSSATKAELRTALSTVKNLRTLVGDLMKFVVKINADGFGKDTGVDAAEIQKAISAAVNQAMKAVEAAASGREKALLRLQSDAGRLIAAAQKMLADAPIEIAVDVQHQQPFAVKTMPAPRQNSRNNGNASSVITVPQQKLLDTLAWLESHDLYPAPKETLAAVANVSPTSGGYFNNLGTLRTAGLIEYPAPGMVAFTEDGRASSNSIDDSRAVHEHWYEVVTAPQKAILEALVARHPESIAKDALAAKIGVSPTSGGYFNNLGRLRTLGAIDYPEKGHVALTRHVMPE